MIVDNVVEHEDGTATLEISDLSQEEITLLIQEGFKSLLMQRIAQDEEERKIPALFRE